MVRGFFYHLQLTLRLNFAGKQPLVYGYLVPFFFLIAFGTVFRAGDPPLLHQMGQLITISALGGACFGLPTALVAERERGWWRRYRLLPRALPPLLASTLVARLVLIASAAGLQIVLARLIYGTPFPSHWGHFAVSYLGTAWAFLGLGLLVAGLAQDVPAVQALGQCVFLPLIMIGGVGIPLIALPTWTQKVAAFLPGRYAVDALNAGFTDDGHGSIFRFNLIALAAIGAAAGIAGLKLFRWDSSHRPGKAARIWIVAAVVPWIAVGLFALRTDRWAALVPSVPDPTLSITDAQIDSIIYDNLPPDDGTVTPISRPNQDLGPDEKARLDALATKLNTWAPGRDPNPAQAIRNLLCVAAIADVSEDSLEGPIARTVLNHLYSHFKQEDLEKGLAAVVIYPDAGTVLSAVPELDVPGEIDGSMVRVRDQIYAVKFIGRVRGKIDN